MRKLLEADSLTDINLIASYLQGNGITVEIQNAQQSAVLNISPFNGLIRPELWVHPDQFSAAAKLVARYQHEQASGADEQEWSCRGCKEGNPDNFESCWSCGKVR
ncbi:MAG TPA: DUF2007 domain-containing protein [Pseudomonas sp.]|nr:DUF2007 domain-containing protein [Pseudomonas sp.]